jgi:hypothetical protein
MARLDDKTVLEGQLRTAREDVIGAALDVVGSRHWAYNHPEDPHCQDSIDLADHTLDAALADWSRVRAKIELERVMGSPEV